MKITETTIVTRANTSIGWPSDATTGDEADPANDRTGKYFQYSISISPDNLSRSVTRVYDNAASFAAVKCYVNSAVESAWCNAMANVGLSLSKTITTSAD